MINRIEYLGMWFSEDTTEEVKRVIVNCYNKHNRIRVWYGFTEQNSLGTSNAGKSWNDENDVCGYIGKSTGSQKIPLLINNSNSSGGGGLLDDCIIKIVDTKTKVVIYQHPNFNQSVFEVVTPSDKPEYGANVLVDGEIYARCKAVYQAKRLADFMNGKRMSK